MAYAPKGPDYDRLHAILRAVLPHHRAISTRVGDELGVFKSIDSSGNVWLIEFKEPYTDERGHHVVRRSKKLEIKADDAAQVAGGNVTAQSRKRSDLWG
jgi:hypothetical protein